MSRLIVALLLSTAVNVAYGASDEVLAKAMNEQIMLLFNDGKFGELVKVAFFEDAVFKSTSTPTPAKGHAAIAAHLKGSFEKYGKLSDLKVISADKETFVVTMKQGTNVKLTITEKVKDTPPRARFTEISIDFQKQ